MADFHTESVLFLARTLSKLNTEKECMDFLEDLCTIKEIQDMAQRLDAAILLEQGCSYGEITQKANISSSTISRVRRSLMYGSGGYKTAIERIKADDNK